MTRHLWIKKGSCLDLQARAHSLHVVCSSLCAAVIRLQQLLVCLLLQELVTCMRPMHVGIRFYTLRPQEMLAMVQVRPTGYIGDNDKPLIASPCSKGNSTYFTTCRNAPQSNTLSTTAAGRDIQERDHPCLRAGRRPVTPMYTWCVETSAVAARSRRWPTCSRSKVPPTATCSKLRGVLSAGVSSGGSGAGRASAACTLYQCQDVQ